MRSKASSFQVGTNLFLVRQDVLADKPAKPVPEPVHHLVIVDCSGSMTGELPQLRRQLKNKLASLVKKDDTVTLIWFSGRGEFGTVIEAEPVHDLPDLKAVHEMVDRWLKPVGLTGFKEPIELATKVIARVGKRLKGVFSLLFLSDGADNQWDRSEILSVVEQASALCSSSVFVEYGYYADRALIAAMAERAGGVHIFAEDFPKFEPILESNLKKTVLGGKRVSVKIEGDPAMGLVFALGDGEVLTFATTDGEVLVPPDVRALYYVSPSPFGEQMGKLDVVAHNIATKVSKPHPEMLGSAYAALALFAVRMEQKLVFPLLKSLGDVRFIDQFANCFGKQKYSAFVEACMRACWDPSLWFVDGRDPNRVPKEDAFTVLDVIQALVEDPEARVLMEHPEFKYNRIGRQQVDAEDSLTDEERSKLEELKDQLASKKLGVADIKRITAEMDALTSAKKDALKFVADPIPDGVSISDLTPNQERPNVSMLIVREGTVDLSARLAGATFAGKDKVPVAFRTKIFRNFTLIKDGLVNIRQLPAKMSRATYDRLAANGVKMVTDPDRSMVALIDLGALPVVNRKMAKTLSAKGLFELEWSLTEAKARQKVVKDYRAEWSPKSAAASGYATVYGPEAAKWLEEQGITDYKGFNPKRVQAPATDFYLGKFLEVTLEGFASLPTVDKVKERMVKLAAGDKKTKPLSGGSMLMGEVITELDGKVNMEKKHRNAWIEGQEKAAIAATRSLAFDKSKQVFITVVGQTWFKEFASLDENSMEIEPRKGLKLTGTVEMKEERIDI